MRAAESRADVAVGRPSWRRSGLVAFLALLAGCDEGLSPPRIVADSSQATVTGQSTVAHSLVLPANVDLEIRLRTGSVDVRVELVANNGTPVSSANAPNDRLGVITFHLPPGDARTTELRIIGEDHARNTGPASLRVQTLPVATKKDRVRLDAVKREAAACAALADTEGATEAAARFAEAAVLRRKIGDDAGAGRALLQEAAVRFLPLGEWQRAADLAGLAAALLTDTGEPALQVRALRLKGAAIQAVAETLTATARDEAYAAARVSLSRAAELAGRRGLPYEAAYAINYRGVGHHYQGQVQQARMDYERALGLFEDARHAPGQSLSIDSLALLHHEQGEFRAALARFDEALALTTPAESPVNYAHTLHNSALPLRVLGRFDEAIARYRRAGELLRGLGEPAEEASALHGIGVVFLHAGEPERARVLLQEALRLQEAAGNRRDQFTALVALADIDREAQRHADARALLERAQALAGQPNEQARVLLGLAEIDRATGNLPAARESASKVLALELPRAHPHRGRAWLTLGTIAADGGQSSAAADAFARALGIFRANGAELEQAEVLARRAAFLLSTGEVAAVLQDTRRAIDLLDKVGAAGLHGQQRAVFLARQRRMIELHIAGALAAAEAAERSGRPREAALARMEAFSASEHSRAGGLLDALARTSSNLPDELRERRSRLVELLAGKRQRRETLQERATADPAAVAALSRDIELLRAELTTVEAAIGRHGGVDPRIAGDWEARRHLGVVPPDHLVAEYFLGDSRGWLFVVRGGQLTVQGLPATADIESAARDLLQAWRTAVPLRNARVASVLSRTVPGPMSDLPPAARVWLIPDGAMHALPLATLVNYFDPDGWLASAEVAVVPSVRAVELANSRARALEPATGTFTVIADPIFEAGDPRIRGAAARRVPRVEAAPPSLVKTRSATRLDSLQRLPATAAEARAIADLVPPERTRLLTGDGATREAVFGDAVTSARYLHFATHGIADSQDPELSALVVSRYASDGTARDGVLRLYDIASLDLAAELVVLSACDTALGRDIRGEGLVGLTHGFLQAGAQTVVASLWQVPDTATAVLMREFYRHLIVDRHSPATALKKAQQYVGSQPHWAEPYYWAGFQVVTVAPHGA